MWKDLEREFSELVARAEDAEVQVRLEASVTSRGAGVQERFDASATDFRLIGLGQRVDRTKFEALAKLAGEEVAVSLASEKPPIAHREILSETDPVKRWYFALWRIGDFYESDDISASEVDATENVLGHVYRGRIPGVVGASSAFCTQMRAEFPLKTKAEPLKAEAPKFLRQIEWFRLHGLRYWKLVAFAAVVLVALWYLKSSDRLQPTRSSTTQDLVPPNPSPIEPGPAPPPEPHSPARVVPDHWTAWVTNSTQRQREYQSTCPDDSYLAELRVSEQSGFGIVNLSVRCRRVGGAGKTLAFMSPNKKFDRQYEAACTDPRTVSQGIAAQEQSGHGVVDVFLACGLPDEEPKNSILSESAVRNPHGETRRPQYCRSGSRVKGVKIGEQSGFGIVDLKVLCSQA